MTPGTTRRPLPELQEDTMATANDGRRSASLDELEFGEFGEFGEAVGEFGEAVGEFGESTMYSSPESEAYALPEAESEWEHPEANPYSLEMEEESENPEASYYGGLEANPYAPEWSGESEGEAWEQWEAEGVGEMP